MAERVPLAWLIVGRSFDRTGQIMVLPTVYGGCRYRAFCSELNAAIEATSAFGRSQRV